jgi:heterodisulfide reductase subunit D
MAIKGENILYFPGCVTQSLTPKLCTNYKSLLSDVGVNFKTIPELSCCGSPLLSSGYRIDFEDVKKKNMDLLRQHNVTKVITNCPHCFSIFKNEYGVTVEHISQTLHNHSYKLNSKAHEDVTYHDPCILAKNGIIKEPRALLKRAGYKIHEPERNKENTFCCGAGGGLKQNSPKLAEKIAKTRLKQTTTGKVIVSCPYCYLHLKECQDAKNQKEIVELSEAVFEE